MSACLSKGRQRGISLVELMIAMLLGLILTAGLIQIVLSNKSAYRINEGLARMQENVRFALGLLARDIRMVGYTGCSSRDDFELLNVLNAPAADQYNLAVGITGYEYGSGGWSSALPDDLSSSIDTGSTALTLELLVDTGNRLASEMSSTADDLQLVSASGLDDQDILLISDCARGTVFQASAVSTAEGSSEITVAHDAGSGSPGNAQQQLSNDYQPFGSDASVWRVTQLTYYVAPSEFTNNRDETVNALWRLEDGEARELIQGVSQLQLNYGIDADGDGIPNRYVDAENVADWSDVIVVTVQLQVNSVDAVGATTEDGRISQVFSQAIKIRNRGLSL